MPQKEYLIWIPNLDSPMNIVSIKESTDNCFAAIITLNVNTSKPVGDLESITPIPGIKFYIYGQSPQTKVYKVLF